MHAKGVLAAILVLAALALLGATTTGRSAADGTTEAAASAYALKISVPGREPVIVAAADGGGGSIEAFDSGDGTVVTGTARTRAVAEARSRGDAIAEAAVDGVSLFGGELTLERATMKATAGAAPGRVGGSADASQVQGLVVLGAPVEPSPRSRVELADWGYAIVLEQTIETDADEHAGFRATIAALHVHLTADHGGLPAGTEIVIGYADASARAEAPTPSGPAFVPSPPKPRADDSPPGGEPGTTEPAAGSRRPPRTVRNPPPALVSRMTKGGYVFPVYGATVGFSNDFGAPRAEVVWHHGNDIFAPEGTPVLAVADGELFSVGWNELGGWRLWLRDAGGNEFYFAHLSAYSPLAFGGSRVQAGDVIGYVGRTGDAETTPPHLHFEIHPHELLKLGYDGVVNPYRALVAWQRLDDVDLAGDAWRPGTGPAPPAAAVLVEAEDISAASGTEPAALEQAMAAADAFVVTVVAPGPPPARAAARPRR